MAHQLIRTISTRWDPASVFDYLLDFENAEEWDAGTVSCRRTSGDGGVGTHYRNVSEFRGNETELDYVVETVEDGRRFVITGTNKTVTSKDTVTVRPAGAGSEVEYRAEMTFKGIAALASPFLSKPLEKLADDTEAQLERALEGRAQKTAG
jgi:carbon monoxide dehydrogenase subunit G